jgi:hypothetical protein
MSHTFILHPLGTILQEADLISSPQLQLALQDQSYYQEMRIGEILALRGWLKQETADFFAEEWVNLVTENDRYPLGFYLQKAALLNEEQIHEIICEQKQCLLRFGAVAVLKGWVKQNTIHFFLQNLFPQEVKASHFIKTTVHNQNNQTNPTLIFKDEINSLAKESELYFTQPSPKKTKKFFTLF